MKNRTGFTLIELLISLSIFTILSLMLSQWLIINLNHLAHLERYLRRWENIQKMLVDFDLNVRKIQNAQQTGELSSIFEGKRTELWFTSSNIRMQYRFQAGKLLTLRPESSLNFPIDMPALRSVSFEFLDAKQVWHSQYLNHPKNLPAKPLPLAIKVSLYFADNDFIQTIIPIPATHE